MVKYLSASTFGLFFLVLLLTTALASKVPSPICNSPKIKLQDLPVSLREVQNYNLNNIFSGYNLNITIPDKPDFVYLRDKVTKLKNVEKQQPGLRNYHLSHEGNQWGHTLVTVSVEENNTRVRWGSSPINSSS